MHFNSTEHTWLLIYVNMGILPYGSTVIEIAELKWADHNIATYL